MFNPLSVVVVEETPERALLIVDCLGGADGYEVHVISKVSGLAQTIAERNPDLVLFDLVSPTRDAIEELSRAAAPLERPVAMFVDESDESLTRAAIEAGVSAYVVNDLRKERIRSVLSAAIARFQVFRRMREELAETKRELEERKLLDRAKRLLMKARGLSEEEAYRILRKTAMDQGKKISEVAAALVTAADLLS